MSLDALLAGVRGGDGTASFRWISDPCLWVFHWERRGLSWQRKFFARGGRRFYLFK